MDKLYDNANISSLDDNLKEFNILLNKLSTSDQQLTEELITNVANTINEHSMYISNNYRTLGDNVSFEGKYPIEKPQNIKRKMQELLSKYYGEWTNLDIFEREAKFNIEFLRIHPFEDGNGRTSRLILNYNMIREGEQLVLSTGYLVSMAETCSIDIETVKGLKNIFLGGEGIFNTIITGPGKVVVQTMPLARLTNSIIPFIPTHHQVQA